MNTWNPRTEILMVAHRWYWVVASFLIGILLGWLVSLVWPAPYRAVQDIYVGLNAYRATRDLYIEEVAQEQFRNLDDYKNWQMGQLNSLALSDEFLTETLIRLQSTDHSWQEVDLPELRAMLKIAWRNTGDWHFSAQADEPAQALQAVLAWSQMVVEEVDLAVEAARQMVVIDSRMQAVSDELVGLETRQVLLRETQTALDEWQVLFEVGPTDQPLSPLEHWALLSRVTNSAGWNMGWLPTLESAPPLGSLAVDYLAWLLQVRALIEAELAVLPVQIEALTSEHAALAAEYNRSADDSRALSANLKVQRLKAQAPRVERLRPTGTLMLIGGGLGFLVWGIFWLAQITRRTA
jgi:hypothetical protein